MADFTRDENIVRPLDHTRASEGYKTAGQAVGDALGNAGEILLRGAKDLDNKMGEYVQEVGKDTKARLDMQFHGVDVGRFPPDVSRAFQKLHKQKASAEAGGTSMENYNVAALAEAKRINRLHPAYGEDFIKGLGFNPANAVIADRQSKMKAANEAANNSTKKDAEFMDWTIKHKPLAFQAWNAGGQKDGIHGLRAAVLKQGVIDDNQKILELTTKNDIESGKYNKERAEADLTKTSDAFADQMLSSVTGDYRAFTDNVKRFMNTAEGGKVSPEAELQLKIQAQNLLLKGREGIDAALRKNPASNAYPEQAEKARKHAYGRLENFVQSIIGKDVNLALVGAAIADPTVETSRLRNINDPKVLTYIELKKNVGEKVAEEWRKEEGLTTTAIGAAFSTDVVAGIVSPDKETSTFKAEMERVWGELKDKGVTDPGAFKEIMLRGGKLLVDESVPLEAKAQAAKFFYDPKNVGYIKNFSEKDQMDVFQTIMNPAMYKSVKDVANNYNKPELEDNYKKLFVSSFGDAMETPVATLNEYQTTIGEGELYVDIATMTVNVQRPDNLKRIPQEQALMKLNQGINILVQHWDLQGKMEPEKKYEAIKSLLESAGLKVGAPKVPGWRDIMSEAWKNTQSINLNAPLANARANIDKPKE